MSNIAETQAKLIASQAEADALRASIRSMSAYVWTKANRDGRDGFIQASDVTHACEQAITSGNDAHEAAYTNEVGPSIADGGCPYVSRRTCSHEPSLRPNAYHCPVCAELLPSEAPWNDTEGRAQERMRVHWRTTTNPHHMRKETD